MMSNLLIIHVFVGIILSTKAQGPAPTTPSTSTPAPATTPTPTTTTPATSNPAPTGTPAAPATSNPAPTGTPAAPATSNPAPTGTPAAPATSNPAPTGTPAAPANPTSTGGSTASPNCTPGTYQLKDQEKLDVTVYFEGGVQTDSEFLVNILDFRKLLKDQSVLTVNLAVGAGIQVANDQITCCANNCADNNQLACVYELAQNEDALEIIYCYLCGHSVYDCASGIIEDSDLKTCVQEKSKSLLLNTRQKMQSSSPQITQYPTAVFNQVFEPCTAQAAFEDFTKTTCAMLKSGKGDGACNQSATSTPAPTTPRYKTSAAVTPASVTPAPTTPTPVPTL